MEEQANETEGLKELSGILSKIPESIGPVWTNRARWLTANHSHSEMEEVLLKLYSELRPISQSKDETTEGALADKIRDACDILWFALPSKRNESVEKRLAELEEPLEAAG
jgi:hypothetical protein